MKKVLFFLGSLFIINACTTGTGTQTTTIPSVDTQKITSLITQKCASCHSSKTSMKGRVKYDSYEDILSGVKGIKRTVVIQRSMPEVSSDLTEEERTLIGQWADQVSK